MRKNQEKFLKYLIIPTILFIFIIINYFNSFPLMMSFSRKIISSDPSNVDIFHIVKKITEGKIYKPTYPYKFKFKYNSSEICENPIKLLFLIKTSPLNLIRRNVIRQTWGSSKNFEEIRTIFLVGERDEDNLKLEKEFEEFHDIVQGNFKDTYYNLTLKTLMGLQWANEFCLENTENFMFVDDDYYVSTKNILKFLENPFMYPGTKNNDENVEMGNPDRFSLYAGNIYVNTRPIREHFSKWFISFDEYPYDKYPPYAASTYILNRETIRRMYYASLFLKPLNFEDVFIGIIAYSLKITPISNKKNIITYGNLYNFQKYKEILATAGYGDSDKLWNVWNEHTVAESKISS